MLGVGGRQAIPATPAGGSLTDGDEEAPARPRPCGRLWQGSGEVSSEDEAEESWRVGVGRSPVRGKCAIPVVRRRSVGTPEGSAARIRRRGRTPVAPTRPPPFRRIPYAEQVRAEPVPPLPNLHDYFVQAMQDLQIGELEGGNGGFEQAGPGTAVGPSVGPQRGKGPYTSTPTPSI